jgi:hypothetical protein
MTHVLIEMTLTGTPCVAKCFAPALGRSVGFGSVPFFWLCAANWNCQQLARVKWLLLAARKRASNAGYTRSQTRVAFQQRHQQLMPEPHSRMPRQHLPGNLRGAQHNFQQPRSNLWYGYMMPFDQTYCADCTFAH